METRQPKKMGRPPVGKQAMTNAERQQRYRDKVKRLAQANKA